MNLRALNIIGWLFMAIGVGCMVWTLSVVSSDRAAAMLPLGLGISALIIGLAAHTWMEARERGAAIAVTSVVSIVVVQGVLFLTRYLMQR